MLGFQKQIFILVIILCKKESSVSKQMFVIIKPLVTLYCVHRR